MRERMENQDEAGTFRKSQKAGAGYLIYLCNMHSGSNKFALLSINSINQENTILV
jgi:hypothetical protein